MRNKLGQVTVFIIIAIVIVAVAILFFAFRGNVSISGVPASIEPVYTSFLSCLEQDTLTGISVLASQAGYIEIPEFEPGSRHMPFSNQLEFAGNAVPYWYYVSGNNIQREQIPSIGQMESQLADFLEDQIINCEFSSFYDQGYEINYAESREVTVSIKENQVEVDLDMGLNVNKDEDSAVLNNHRVVVNSKLGSLYNAAVDIYEKEQSELFLEKYAVDTLFSYAPVDGVEVTCGPKIWNAEEVFDDLESGIEANTLALKSKGDSDDYFLVKELPSDSGIEVRFINSKEWPHGFEVDPSDGPVLVAKPVGNQPGLGILGFCYVPYHFVYDVKYPVLVQVSSGVLEDGDEEVFQFPLAVVLQGNNPREPLSISAVELQNTRLCEYQNTPITVNVYDNNLNPVDADISFRCFSDTCNIGETSGGVLSADFPQCVNGFVVAEADGFREKKQLLSTVESGSVDIVLDRIYELNVDLLVDRRGYGDDRSQGAIISFVSDDGITSSIVYPDQDKVKLSEGQYEIQVFVHEESSLKLGSSIQEQCYEVPKGGLGGLLGLKEETCVDIEIPDQTISNALAGGGKQNYFMLDSELAGASTIEINAQSLPVPKDLEDLQINYILFENKGLDILFK